MESYSLHQLYDELINDLFSAETQIEASLPQWIDVASSADLREELNHYLVQVRHHLDSLSQIFEDLNEKPKGHRSGAVEGIVALMTQVVHHGGNSPVKDAGIIANLQRLQHYKMATYGTARTFARHLDNNKAMDALQRALNEEGESDRKMTRLAEGGFLTKGINQEAQRVKTS